MFTKQKTATPKMFGVAVLIFSIYNTLQKPVEDFGGTFKRDTTLLPAQHGGSCGGSLR